MTTPGRSLPGLRMRDGRLHGLMLLALALWLCLPAAAFALDFGFRPPRGPDDPAAADVMRDLAKRIVPIYQDADTDVYLTNVIALQAVSGAYGAAYDSTRLLGARYRGKPSDGRLERATVDAIYAHARVIEAKERIAFDKAYARAFQEIVSPLGNAQAAALIERLETPLPAFREPVRVAFERWRKEGRIPQSDALALVRDWLAYESRRSFAALLPQLAAAENRRRYVVSTVAIPVRGGVIHASVVRPGAAKNRLPALMRFTIDPSEDDAQRSAFKGYAGITAYVRGRSPDGRGAAWPFVRDGEDAVAVIDWIARQPWSDGRVAMFGDGYAGYTAWAAARRRPAALKAIATIAPMAPGIDFPKSGQIYHNAMVRWAQEHAAGPAAAAQPRSEADSKWAARDLRWYLGDSAYWDIDRVLVGRRSRLVRTWLTHPSHDRYWQKFLPTDKQFAQIDIPVLTIAGYFGAEAGALYYYREHLRHRPLADSTLLIGPYDGDSIRAGTSATLRGYSLDPAARVDLPELRYEWLDHVLNGAPKPALLRDRVNYEVMGAGEWRHVPTLDAPERAALRLYLSTAKGAGRADAPYALSAQAPAGGGSVQLRVDLRDRRDAQRPWSGELSRKQLPVRNGLAFASEPVAKETLIEGSLKGVFDITPSRQDVDFDVSLFEQKADGSAELLFEPYDFRASYAGGRVKRRLLRAGERQSLSFTAERMTARRLAAGSRLVLVIGLNKRPDRQINYGSGKDVNSETVADAGRPVRVRWHAGSHVEIGTRGP